FSNTHLPIPRPKVKFREILCFAQLVEQVRNERDGILILHSHLVKGSIIDA
ncbi:unnamed protein product, partial [Musa textilis]